VTAVLNLPLIADTLAVRGVIYDDRRGGYINNVPATFTRKPTDLGIHYANYPDGCGTDVLPCQVPPSAASTSWMLSLRCRPSFRSSGIPALPVPEISSCYLRCVRRNAVLSRAPAWF